MILECYNTEPDGRLVIDLKRENLCSRIIIPVDWIDELADGINKHCGSEGDGEGFSLEDKDA